MQRDNEDSGYGWFRHLDALREWHARGCNQQTSDGGLLLGFAKSSSGNQTRNERDYSDADVPWYSCVYCLHESARMPVNASSAYLEHTQADAKNCTDETCGAAGIQVHRSDSHGTSEANITALTLAFIQSDLRMNGLVEFQVAMSTSQNTSAPSFVSAFFVEVVLQVQHKRQIVLQEDQDDSLTACALAAAFIPSLRLTEQVPFREQQPFNLSLTLLTQISQDKGLDGGGGGFLYGMPTYVASGSGCWELDLQLVPDRYGNQTYALLITVDTLSGQRSVTLDNLNVFVAAVNDPPYFELAGLCIWTTEDEYLTSGYLSGNGLGAIEITAGPYEPLQNVSFVISFVAGQSNLYSKGPDVQNDGSVTLQSSPLQRGSALYSLLLTDANGGANTSLIRYLSFYVEPVNRRPCFNSSFHQD